MAEGPICRRRFPTSWPRCEGQPSPAFGDNFHDAAEAALLNNNRHATCVDCTARTPPTGNAVCRAAGHSSAAGGATGISALDGITSDHPAINQYETCLRCHGTSTGKQRLIIYGYAPIRVVAAADP